MVINNIVQDHPRPLTIRLGGGKQTVIPRRVTTFTFSLSDFQDFITSAFVMGIPESCDIKLGMPWLEDVNPIIDWASKTVQLRPKVAATVRVDGRRCGYPRLSPNHRAKAQLREYFIHEYQSEASTTRLVRPHDLRKLLTEDDNEYCFLINAPDTQAVTSKAAAAWNALKDTPVYPLLLEFRDVEFRSELPSVAPTRKDNMDASIDVSDAIPVHRKQFLFSKVQREAILKWTQEMLKARLIRPSSPPDCAPTFCWRIVHDFRRLNTKVRVPAKPIPGKDEIFRAMANARIFSALDLLWNFFQGKLREVSIPYTTFSTPDGLFKYPVTPMGISFRSCFHRLVQSIFNDYDSFCRTYFDNLFIFIPSDSVKAHMRALRKVLTRCAEKQLYVKIEKCVFCAREIPCLGDIVGVDG
ncbi:hypothetical protein PHMEG_00022677, partial [Phytophthora megakarya]